MLRRNLIWITGFVLALAFDFLFWGHTPGISFFVFIVLCLAGGILTAARAGVYANWKSLLLVPAILASASITFLRAEPFTGFCGGALAMLLMMVLASTYKGGRWPFYGILDHLMAAFWLSLHAALHPALLPAEKPVADSGAPVAGQRRWIWPVARGVLMAIPVLLFFAALLASADPVFNQLLAVFFDIERLPEYIFRLFYILVGAYLLVGVFLHSILASKEEGLPAADKPRIRPFVGSVEAMVVLGSVAALFALFVAIQFRYFFGGEQNIGVEGFTFSEYARQGFGELVTVAFFSLLLFLGLGSLTRRETPNSRKVFSGLGILLVLMVVVMLISSFQRLRLYENAYGFTELRMYTYVFIVWLGILLVGVAVLEVLGRIGWFSAAALITGLGFTLSLAILNVDASIVRLNGERTRQGYELDALHLRSLSLDAVPAMLELYTAQTGGEQAKDTIGADLACRLYEMEKRRDTSWQSYRWPEAEALRLLRESDIAEKYPILADRDWYVTVAGEDVYCYQSGWMD